MASFKQIYARAAKRKGGEAALEKLIAGSKPKSKVALKKLGDDRYLAEMTKRIFQAGFVWRVVEQKWPDFEAAFQKFDVGRMALLSDEDLDVLSRDSRIIRHGAKIAAVRHNAIFLSDLAREHGSAARFFADWPSEDIVNLWALLKKRGARLGGYTGPYFLRFMGKDSFLLSPDVTAALIRAKVVDKNPTGKADLAKVQAAFNGWQQETGRSLTQLSRILANSIDAPREK
ncbi:3-methyladenine DNA glycosylase [Pelagibius litoralis]|uniref:3-methyladenine DNA glycosylase n=1 Tax=Pelagibius litoralis TaxID=374515 RepID=A0A967C269_9PROT|nr:DNA-3-methyladenine glycosylase I [Pelagibius litoralis]NIA68896.1 3-methyladenine DNA glycosylase [Pelagibius litoralis]